MGVANPSARESLPPGGGGHWNNSVVHIHDQRNSIKGLFFEAKCDSREALIRGQNVPIFEKRVLLDYIKGI